ncbi:uncharacterized protein LOC129966739 [Argiope bruennichi]|uniref:uncharacterized protein LOC129966739 n=1 Tax=Argiope bruennichi TaxID=94029 RepID=UPI0024955D5E|nr:uncharacterized protein LOC129966739 [Argiope bruennichi]
MNHGDYYKDTSVGNGSENDISCIAFGNWKPIVELYQEFSACRRLTKNHIVVVSGLKKMNMKLPDQVPSHTVALSLYVAFQKIESNAIDTTRFITKMDVLFDTVNSKTLKHLKK